MTLRNRKFLRKITPYANLRRNRRSYDFQESPMQGQDFQHDRSLVNEIPLQVEDPIQEDISTSPLPCTDDPVPEETYAKDKAVDNIHEFQEPGSNPRRSTRVRQAPERLNIRSFNGQSYDDDTAKKSVAISLTSCWPVGGGGINDIR